MPIETLHTGWVSGPGDIPPDPRVAAGPRVVRHPGGTVVCSFMRQTALGVNDFQPYLADSLDQGTTWEPPRPVWPQLADRWSIFVSLSCDAAGNLYLFGTRTPIDQPGESFWSDAAQGLKQNQLIWAISTDRGQTWQHATMLAFPELRSGGAEVWVVQLSDGRIVGTGWHIDLDGQTEYPNGYALSVDDGSTWSPTGSTGTMGQSTALYPVEGNRVWFVYNQRKHGTPGVWLALANPTKEAFQILDHGIGWKAPATTRSGSSGDHDEWTDFAFGEPSLAVLDDQTLLLVLWCIQADGKGFRYVRLRYTPSTG